MSELLIPTMNCCAVAGTGRIARFELVPLEELLPAGRPRVDVLCNMSGIFRDSFQNVVRLGLSSVSSGCCMRTCCVICPTSGRGCSQNLVCLVLAVTLLGISR